MWMFDGYISFSCRCFGTTVQTGYMVKSAQYSCGLKLPTGVLYDKSVRIYGQSLIWSFFWTIRRPYIRSALYQHSNNQRRSKHELWGYLSNRSPHWYSSASSLLYNRQFAKTTLMSSSTSLLHEYFMRLMLERIVPRSKGRFTTLW